MTLSRFENTHLETVQQPPGLLDTYLEDHSDDPELIAESLTIDLMENVVRLQEQKGISRSGLADLMNVSKAYVTRLLNTPPNLTLMSVARLSVALNAKPYIGLMEREPIGFEINIAHSGVTSVGGDMVTSHSTTPGNISGFGDTGLILEGMLWVNVTRRQLKPVTAGLALAPTATSEGVLKNA